MRLFGHGIISEVVSVRVHESRIKEEVTQRRPPVKESRNWMNSTERERERERESLPIRVYL